MFWPPLPPSVLRSLVYMRLIAETLVIPLEALDPFTYRSRTGVIHLAFCTMFVHSDSVSSVFPMPHVSKGRTREASLDATANDGTTRS